MKDEKLGVPYGPRPLPTDLVAILGPYPVKGPLSAVVNWYLRVAGLFHACGQLDHQRVGITFNLLACAAFDLGVAVGRAEK